MEIRLQSRRAWLWLILAAGIVIGTWFLPTLLQVFLLIFAGALFGNFLGQLTLLLARRCDIRYGLAYSTVVASLSLIVAGTFYYMGSRISSQVTQLIEQLNQAGSQVSSEFNVQSWWEKLKQLGPKEQPFWAANRAVTTATSAVWMTLSAIGSIAIVAFLGFYFALQPDLYRRGFLALIAPAKRNQANEVLDRAGSRLWRWVVGRLIGMAVIAICTAIGLWLLGIPLPITLAMLAGLMNFVPNIGPIIAGVPAVLLGFQQGTNIAIYVVVFYFLLQFLESYFLTPLIDQHQVSIPPGLMLSAQLLLGVMAGFLGLLLATPLTVLLTILINDLYVKQRSPVASD